MTHVRVDKRCRLGERGFSGRSARPPVQLDRGAAQTGPKSPLNTDFQVARVPSELLGLDRYDPVGSRADRQSDKPQLRCRTQPIVQTLCVQPGAQQRVADAFVEGTDAPGRDDRGELFAVLRQ